MSTKINLTNREYLQLFRGLTAVKEIKGSRFAVLVGRNIKELQTVLEPIELAAAPSVEFQQLSVQMQDLIDKEDQEAMDSLEKENKNLIDIRKKQLEDVEEILDGTKEVHVHMLREDQLPEDITGEQVSNILQILT
tara:strand:+ start:160 stop:567 length:408 start_codon:yes stop_codon:yes gene_type:complete